ncbi:hypothetical protein BCAH1134_C0420 (plasmid) [Bacillus cereus AH1134]|nr:hypothetical protein BCAH1134_C0420 [Bacillus cereus AH1134]
MLTCLKAFRSFIEVSLELFSSIVISTCIKIPFLNFILDYFQMNFI